MNIQFLLRADFQGSGVWRTVDVSVRDGALLMEIPVGSVVRKGSNKPPGFGKYLFEWLNGNVQIDCDVLQELTGSLSVCPLLDVLGVGVCVVPGRKELSIAAMND